MTLMKSGDPIVDTLCARLAAESQGDGCVHRVIGKMIERSKAGQRKYGIGLDRQDLQEEDWLWHAQMEAMDLANYLQVLIMRFPCAAFEKMQEEALVIATQLEASLETLQQRH